MSELKFTIKIVDRPLHTRRRSKYYALIDEIAIHWDSLLEHAIKIEVADAETARKGGVAIRQYYHRLGIKVKIQLGDNYIIFMRASDG